MSKENVSTQLEVVAPDVESNEIISNNGSYKDIIRKAIANGAKKFSGLKIKSVNATIKENSIMVSFTLKANIPAFVPDAAGNYSRNEFNVVYTNTFALIGMMKENDEFGWSANLLKNYIDDIIDNDELDVAAKERKISNKLNLIFFGASLTLLQIEYLMGDTIKNIFSTNTRDDSDPYVASHDTIVNYPIEFKFGPMGTKQLMKFADID